MSSKAFRQPPSLNRPVGFELAAPDEVEITPGVTVRCAETRDGRTVGELEVAGAGLSYWLRVNLRK